MIDLSIIIVSYNAREDLERCVTSIRQSPPHLTHEIVLVDNGSTDGSAGAARQWPDVRVIETKENRGFATANNVGFRNSTGTNVLLLNSDTIIPPGAIDTLVRELEAHPDAAVAGPRIVDGQGHAELSFGRMISPLNELRQKRLVEGHAARQPAVSARVEAMTKEEQWPDWVSGACLLVRRKDAEAVGLLDERFFLYTEDVDFCASIRARGRRILFAPAAEIVHFRGRSAASAPAATREACHRSRIAFYEKHHPLVAPLLRWYLSLRKA